MKMWLQDHWVLNKIFQKLYSGGFVLWGEPKVSLQQRWNRVTLGEICDHVFPI